MDQKQSQLVHPNVRITNFRNEKRRFPTVILLANSPEKASNEVHKATLIRRRDTEEKIKDKDYL